MTTRERPAPPPGSPRLLTVDQVAAALGIGRTTAYEMVQRGEIPRVRLRGRRLIRVSEEALLAWVRAGGGE